MNGGMYRPPSDRFGGNADTMKAATTEGVQRSADAAERQAAALEGLLALLAARLPDLVAPPAPQAAAAPAPAAIVPGSYDDWSTRVPSYLRWVNHDSRCAELVRIADDARSLLMSVGRTVDERKAAQETIANCKRLLASRRNKLKKLRYKMQFIDDVLYRYDFTTQTREVWQAAFLPY